MLRCCDCFPLLLSVHAAAVRGTVQQQLPMGDTQGTVVSKPVIAHVPAILCTQTVCDARQGVLLSGGAYAVLHSMHRLS